MAVMEDWSLPRPEWVHAQEARALRDMDLPSVDEMRDSVGCMVHRAVDAVWLDESNHVESGPLKPKSPPKPKPKPGVRLREVLSYVPLEQHAHRWPDGTETTHLHFRNNHRGHLHTTSWGEHPGLDDLPGSFRPPPSKWVPVG